MNLLHHNGEAIQGGARVSEVDEAHHTCAADDEFVDLREYDKDPYD